MMPPWNEIVVALLLLASGATVATAAFGLWRLPNFFSRMHAPALASTLAVWLAAAAAVVHFWAREGSPPLQVLLAVALLAITAPVTTIVLARAALFRRRHAGDDLPAPLCGPAGPGEAPRA